MADDVWITVCNWGKFQNYKDRRLLWVKVYVELMRRDEWLHLSLSERGLLVCIWLEYGPRRGQLRTSDLPGCVLQKVPRRSLDSLVGAGFIELSDIRPQKLPRTDPIRHSKEVEKEVEVETPLPPQDVGDDFFEPPTPKTGTRASGTNPRAQAQTDKEQVHKQLLEHAKRVAAEWNGGGSDVFDETLDGLELEHHDRFKALERDDLWDKAFKR